MKKRLLLLAAVFVLFSGFTLSWDPVTKYTDNTVIGTEAQGVFYNVEMDNTAASGRFSGNSWVIPSPGAKGTPHSFRVRTELGALDNTGQPYRSVWSPSYGWAVPLVNPGNPLNLRVAQ